MILRKPYAFFIKYFRIIHLIMAFFMCLLLLQTNSFLSFFNTYVNSNIVTIGRDLNSEIFLRLTYLYIVIVLITDVIVWILLEVKHKKRLFYIINFVGYALVLALYIYTSSLLNSMGKQIVDIRIVMSIRDLVIITFVFQTLSIFITVIRFLGFDIKKFDFESDLQELNITSADNEEFEVNLNFDFHKVKRLVIEKVRNFRYYFKENLRIIIPIILISISLVTYVIFKSINGNTTTYKENVYFSVPNYSLKVVESYVTTKDYKMNNIGEDKALVILKVSVKSYNDTKTFSVGNFALQIGQNKYYHVISYNSSLLDIGQTYIKQTITEDYADYLLVYEIPKDQINSNKALIYVNAIKKGILSRDTITRVTLNTKNLDKEQVTKELVLNEDVNFNSNFINLSTLSMQSISLDKLFIVPYNKCIFTNECYDFVEPIQAEFLGSNDKALLKISVSMKFKEGTSNNVVNTLKQFVRIKYQLNGKEKTYYLNKQVTRKKDKSKTDYYFEVPAEIINAESIKFLFSTREFDLIYTIK